MTVMPIDLYGDALRSHTGPNACRCDKWRIRYADGRDLPLAVARWCQALDDADRELLARCDDPVLDVGCGPGRLVAALCADGRRALGVDVAAAAVRLARDAGATVVRRSIFDPLPDEGRWRAVLLADGNIGIGGDPVTLLERCRDLLAPDGVILTELDPPGSTSSSVQVRLEAPHERSAWFTWAHVAADEVAVPASRAGLHVVDAWTTDDRWFACLSR
jgi:SAM-dependent methyltransferase